MYITYMCLDSEIYDNGRTVPGFVLTDIAIIPGGAAQCVLHATVPNMGFFETLTWLAVHAGNEKLGSLPTRFCSRYTQPQRSEPVTTLKVVPESRRFNLHLS